MAFDEKEVDDNELQYRNGNIEVVKNFLKHVLIVSIFLVFKLLEIVVSVFVEVAIKKS